MAKGAKRPKTLVLRSDEQRRALASPLRLELVGQFVERRPLSVAELAERMGRPATGIHYHVKVLEQAGLLRRVGEQRSGRRTEALYRPVADVYKLDEPRDSEPGDIDASVKAVSMAFRMAVADMKAAFEDPSTRDSGPQRNFLAGRFHCRLSKQELVELNRHLRAIEKMLSGAPKPDALASSDVFVSLTLALMPLRNREVQS